MDINTFNVLYKNNKNITNDGIIQLLPEKLNYLLNNRIIRYKNKNLKTDYIINLLHNILIKHYINTNHNINLSSNILKKIYGQYYNYYLSYLIDNNILKMRTNYIVGKKSKTFYLNESVLKDNIDLYKINNKFLIKKIIKINNNTKKINVISDDIKQRVINDLFKIKIDYDNCIDYLNNIKNENALNKAYLKYNIECIYNGIIFYKFDDYGRLHTNFTTLKSDIRKKFLRINGEEIVEIDNKNSQMLFLTKIIEDKFNDIINIKEFEKFKELSYGGHFYDYIMNKYEIKNRKYVKKISFYVVCGMNSMNKKSDRIFYNEFPTIYEFILKYKKEKNNYKSLSYELQRYESDFIFNKLLKKIYEKHPNIITFTVHDCIAIQKSLYNDIILIYNDVYNQTFK